MGLVICTFHMDTWRHREGLADRRSHSKQSLGSKWGQLDPEARDQGFLKEVWGAPCCNKEDNLELLGKL